MAVRYNKLFHLLIDRKMSNAQLAEQAGISLNIVTRLKRDEYVSLETVEKICHVLQCRVDDILDFYETEKTSVISRWNHVEK